MISIIICSRNSDIPPSLRKNIEETIGFEFEIITIDNSKNKYSICSAYNYGVEQAIGDILCFMHEDILFHTDNWGTKVLKHFEDNLVGLIGVLGSQYLPKATSYWSYTNMLSGRFIQLTKNNNSNEKVLIEHMDYIKDNSIEAVAIDGLWFCLPKKIFNQIRFDEISFKNFHGYDIDISLQVRQNKLKVLIIADILIEHQNINGVNSYYKLVQSLMTFNNKWKNTLPQVAGVEITESELKIRETYMKSYFDLILEYNNAIIEIDRLNNSKSYKIGKFITKWLNTFNIFR